MGLSVSCSSARPPEGLTSTGRFEWAQTRFDARDYTVAIRAFRDFLLRDPLNPLVDSAQYMIAEAELRNGEVLVAAGDFEQLATSRPNGPMADAAQFGACRAYWKLSPNVALEQENTRLAIEACRRLLQFFPDSPLRPRAEEIVAKGNAKLAEKQYRIAHFYFRNKLYESANIYYQRALETGPRAPIVPRVLAELYESYRRLGFDSEAAAVRQRLLTEYADSEQARKLQKSHRDNG